MIEVVSRTQLRIRKDIKHRPRFIAVHWLPLQYGVLNQVTREHFTLHFKKTKNLKESWNDIQPPRSNGLTITYVDSYDKHHQNMLHIHYHQVHSVEQSYGHTFVFQIVNTPAWSYPIRDLLFSRF